MGETDIMTLKDLDVLPDKEAWIKVLEDLPTPIDASIHEACKAFGFSRDDLHPVRDCVAYFAYEKIKSSMFEHGREGWRLQDQWTFRSAHEDFAYSVSEALDRLVDRLARVFDAYIEMVCAGEARYLLDFLANMTLLTDDGFREYTSGRVTKTELMARYVADYTKTTEWTYGMYDKAMLLFGSPVLAGSLAVDLALQSTPVGHYSSPSPDSDFVPRLCLVESPTSIESSARMRKRERYWGLWAYVRDEIFPDESPSSRAAGLKSAFMTSMWGESTILLQNCVWYYDKEEDCLFYSQSDCGGSFDRYYFRVESGDAYQCNVGGPSWGSAASVLETHRKRSSGSASFVNLVWSLEHNNGSLFNKVWRSQADKLKSLLSLQAADDYSGMVALYCSEFAVRSRWERFLRYTKQDDALRRYEELKYSPAPEESSEQEWIDEYGGCVCCAWYAQESGIDDPCDYGGYEPDPDCAYWSQWYYHKYGPDGQYEDEVEDEVEESSGKKRQGKGSDPE